MIDSDCFASVRPFRPAPVLAIVVPCLDEAETLLHTDRVLSGKIVSLIEKGQVSDGSFVLYVDDGSTDGTWDVIERLAAESVRSRGLKLASNAGHQLALMAGLEAVSGCCDAAISIDADLQDDVEAIDEMTERYRSGFDVVYGVRRHRKEDGVFKRTTAKGFYRLRNALGMRTVNNHADYRLLSAAALKGLCRYRETNLFLRGIVPMLGLRQTQVFYDRKPRVFGRSKYPVGKMLNFAADGITSFSVRPARMILSCGLVFVLISLGILTYVLVRHFTGHTIPGWASIILSIWFCTGVLLLALGIIGEYLGKVYMEVKRRPRWQEERRLNI